MRDDERNSTKTNRQEIHGQPVMLMAEKKQRNSLSSSEALQRSSRWKFLVWSRGEKLSTVTVSRVVSGWGSKLCWRYLLCLIWVPVPAFKSELEGRRLFRRFSLASTPGSKKTKGQRTNQVHVCINLVRLISPRFYQSPEILQVQRPAFVRNSIDLKSASEHGSGSQATNPTEKLLPGRTLKI